MKIKVSYGFVALFALFYVLDSQKIFMLYLLSAAIHELFHILAIYLTGNSIDHIDINILGGVIFARYHKLSYRNEVIISAAGPLSNIAIAIILSFINSKSLDSYPMYIFCGASFIIGIFNLLPIYPLDGGKILYNVICMYSDNIKSIKILTYISICTSVIICAAGALMVMTTKYNFTLLFIGLYLLINQKKTLMLM